MVDIGSRKRPATRVQHQRIGRQCGVDREGVVVPAKGDGTRSLRDRRHEGDVEGQPVIAASSHRFDGDEVDAGMGQHRIVMEAL